METIAQLSVGTGRGTKALELHRGDITGFADQVDLLVVSAFRGGYEPVVGSLIDSLKRNLEIDVGALRQTCSHDRTRGLGLWISQPLKSGPFKRVLCQELLGVDQPLKELMENLFLGVGVLEGEGERVGSIALPLIGAGLQFIEPRTAAGILVPAALRELEQSRSLERVIICEIDPDRVAVVRDVMEGWRGSVI